MTLATARLDLMREELRRRTKVSAAEQVARVAITTKIRAFYYDKQRAFLTSRAKRRATRKTRRSGATTGGTREFLARAIETPGFRATYCNATRIEAKALAWRSDTKSGFCDLVELFGRVRDDGDYDLPGGVIVHINEAELALEFTNGARLDLFGADDERALDKLRGRAKHVIWVDEAQKFRFLRKFILEVASPALRDFDGELWLTGTPDRDCSGYFYDVTRQPELGPGLGGWEVHCLAVTDNPAFGSTETERWARTAAVALEENSWAGDEPEFLREWRGLWVQSDARYVYAVHAAPIATLTYAPMRLDHAGWLDYDRAIADLPKPTGARQRRTWLTAVGADFGYDPDPFAVVVWAFTYDLPDVWELFSWKQNKMLPSDQRDRLQALYDVCENLMVMVGDPGGLQGANLIEWQERTGLPIEPADKAQKRTHIEMYNGDIKRGLVHFREDSPLLVEHRNLVWLKTLPGKPQKEHADRRLADGSCPGNHCLVAGTLVATERGDVPIESVIVGERVWTRAGLRRVVQSMPTRKAETLRLILENGRSIVGTGDHPIMTQRGWKPLESLTPDDMVSIWASTVRARQSRLTGSAIADIRTDQRDPSVRTTRGRSSRTDEPGPNTCIGQSGNRSTAPPLSAFMSIIVMTILLTTRWIISYFAKAGSIFEITRWSRLASRPRGAISRSPDRMPHSGTALPMASSGIASRAPRSQQASLSTIADASSAAMTFAPRIQRQRCAAAPAVQQSDGTLALMTRRGRVSSAASNSGATSIGADPRVARTRVLAVESTGCVEQTFDLTVEGVHEFFANGILVHNCSDAAQYAFRHLTHHLHRTPTVTAEEDRIEDEIDRVTDGTVRAKREAGMSTRHEDDDGWSQLESTW